MIRVNNVKAPLSYGAADLVRLAEAKLNARGAVASARVAKKSVDARDKGDVHFVLALDVTVRGDERRLLERLPKGTQAAPLQPEPPAPRYDGASLARRPLVVGLGPAGLFAAYTLALSGARPLMIERGPDVDTRARRVRAFWRGGPFDPEANVQFGEGGAGAFSDGKLTTGISDPRCARVLRTLYECGAPEEILYMARPHIGTDRLPGAVKALRGRIAALGGEARFETRLAGLETADGRVAAAVLAGADGSRETVPVDAVILAVGHSARDTFEMLRRLGAPMARKPFSIGARIEHSQRMIDLSQYGAAAGHPALGAADYKLSVRLPNGRSAYTFCMCPGGEVVAAASEAGGVVTNGMSAFARDGRNANSALLVGVEPADFGEGDDPLAGVRFQRRWERLAFELGGGNYRAPAQRVGDFLRGAARGGEGDVEPTYRPGVTYANLAECLPGFVAESMRGAIERMDRQLRGFASPGAVLTGVETRSSSPVRILRDERCQSAVRGLYPCGEGAGYAGGILSAAVDGIRCAEALLADRSGEKGRA